MADPFDSAWLKWAGAITETHVLAENVNAFRELSPNLKMSMAFWPEYDPKRHCIVYTVAQIESPFPPYWGILLGNIVHNYRCALDHIAWAIYKRGRTPNVGDEREKKIYFPVTRSPGHFKGVVGKMLPGATRADIATVRSFQPYRAGRRMVEAHVVWVLHGLALDDKHRAIQPVAPVPDSTDMWIGPATDCIYRRMAASSPRAVLEPGAELARIYVKKTGPHPYVHVEPHFTIDPSINARLTLEQFLLKTREVVSRILYAFAEPPPSVEKIVGSIPPRPE